LTPQLALLLRGSVSLRFPENGEAIAVLDRDWQPPLVDAAALAAARTQIVALRRYLTPVDDFAWLHQRIATWLAQAKWQDELDEDAIAMVLADWEAALLPFPKWAITAAARVVISRISRFSIADAVAACTAQVADAHTELAALEHLADPTEQERACRRRDERAAEERRAAERKAYVKKRNAEDPNWSPIKDALRNAGLAFER
jgi:hypothetical protein